MIGMHENIAACTAEFFGAHRQCRAFYDRYGPELGGFPGLWRHCIEIAVALQEAEEVVKHEGLCEGIDYTWLDVVIRYVAHVHRQAERTLLNAAQLKDLALTTIREEATAKE